MTPVNPPPNQTPAPPTAGWSVKLVIDDAKRVRKIDNRGEDDYRQLHRQTYADRKMITIDPQESHRGNIIQGICQELANARAWLIPNIEPFFIPRAKFDNIMTPEVVLQIIQQLPSSLSPKGPVSFAQEVYYGSNETKAPCRKLLAALMLTGDRDEPEKRIDALIKLGMSDDCLPLLTRHDSREPLFCRLHGDCHRVINTWGWVPETWREEFTKWSRALMTPFVLHGEGPHCHFIMEGGGSLPTFTEVDEKRKDTNSGESRQDPCESLIKKTTADPNEHKTGGFGEVRKVRIDAGDRMFNVDGEVGGGRSNAARMPQFFALKKLLQNDNVNDSDQRKGFDLEVRSLIFAESRANRIPEDGDTETKRHLIQLLASFEVKNTISDNPTYYLLFPWADGNLEDFWKEENHRRNPRDTAQLDFMVNEFYYLSKALQCVHNDRQQISQNTGSDGHRYGFHGDITPRNFLFFRNIGGESKPWLNTRIVLADFGLGSLHSKLSKSNQSQNRFNTATYAAPEYEVEGLRLSPKADVFSLGCVFLCYIAWLFDGSERFKEFDEERKAEKNFKRAGTQWVLDTQWELDNYWKTTKEGQADIKDSVKNQIDHLLNRDDCVEVVGEILTLIKRKMLQAKKEDRFGAQDLSTALQKILKKWKRRDSFYGKRAWKNSELPKTGTSSAEPIRISNTLTTSPEESLARAWAIQENDTISTISDLGSNSRKNSGPPPGPRNTPQGASRDRDTRRYTASAQTSCRVDSTLSNKSSGDITQTEARSIWLRIWSRMCWVANWVTLPMLTVLGAIFLRRRNDGYERILTVT